MTIEEPDLEVLDGHPATGLAAVKAVLESAPDVALLDLWMDGMTGFGATRVLKKRSPRTQVILLGWFFGSREVVEAGRAGAAYFLPKSAEVSEIRAAVRQAGRMADSPQDAKPPHPGNAGQDEPTWEMLLSLTIREIEILSLLPLMPGEAIAQSLSLTPGTLKNYIQSILEKTGAHTRQEAIDLGRRYGLI